MKKESLRPEQIIALAALANGIIPPDGIDTGAAAVNAGPRLAEKIEAGVNASLYLQGLKLAEEIARQKFHRSIEQLSAAELHELLAEIREKVPGFFKQLRMDVSALYLSNADVWQRIGFPGPSTATGGYADFDQPQITKAKL
jgi:hypothetical protein